MNRTQRLVGVGTVLLVTTFGATACGSDDSDEPTPAETPAAEETEDEPQAAEGQPEWSVPIAEGGEVIATAELGDLTFEARQMSVEKASKTGSFVDPENNEPIVAEGDDVVYVQYVVTNNGDPVDLGSSLVSVDARYDDWPYMQGMDGVSDVEQAESLGLSTSTVAPGQNADPAVYTLGSGEAFAVSENFLYQQGSEIIFDVSITPVDSEGDLLHDDRIEEEATGTIS